MADDIHQKIKSLKEVAANFSQDPYIWKQLSQLAWQAGAKESLDFLEKALILNPTSKIFAREYQEILSSGFFTIGAPSLRHRGEISQVSFTSDGKILTASRDKTAILWHVTGKELQRYTGHQKAITSLHVCPTQPWFVTGSEDHTCRVWDIAAGKEILLLSGHKGPVYAVLFTPDGTQVLSASEDKTCKLWDLSTSKEILSFEGHTNPATALSISQDGKLVASGDSVGGCLIWIIASGKVGKAIPAHSKKITSLCFSSNKRNLLSASQDGTLKLWDAALGKEIKTFEGHQGTIYEAYFIQEESTVVSCSQDKTIRFWDAQEGKEKKCLRGHTKGIYSFAIHPNGIFAVSSGREQYARRWKLPEGIELYTPQGPSARIYDQDCYRVLATAQHDDICHIWNPVTGTKILSLEHENSMIHAVALSPDGKHVVAGGGDWIARVWDIHRGCIISEFQEHKGVITTIAFSPNGEKVASGDRLGDAYVWNPATGQVRIGGNLGMGAIHVLQFFPHGEYIAIGTEHLCLLMNMEQAEEVGRFTGHSGGVHLMAITDDEKVLTSSIDGIRYWEGSTGKEIFHINEHPAPIRGLSLLSDQQYCVSGDETGLLCVWNLKKGVKFSEQQLEEPIYNICLNAQEQEILIALESGRIRRIPEYKLL